MQLAREGLRRPASAECTVSRTRSFFFPIKPLGLAGQFFAIAHMPKAARRSKVVARISFLGNGAQQACAGERIVQGCYRLAPACLFAGSTA